MNTDAYFAIGKTHTVNEDYARSSGPNSKRHSAVISDGCSSSPDTDFGSRFLTIAAMERISLWGDNFDHDWVIWRASETASKFGSRCLDATLVGAFCRDDGDIETFAAGDGVIAARDRETGQIESWVLNFNNAPGYLSYILERGRLEQYLSPDPNRSPELQGGCGQRTVTRFIDGEMKDAVQDRITMEKETRSYFHEGFLWRQTLSAAKYDLVMVLSDGAESFQQPADDGSGTFDSVSVHEVLPHLMAIRNPGGEFLQARCKRFLKRHCTKNGWHHTDDLAVAAILIPQDQP